MLDDPDSVAGDAECWVGLDAVTSAFVERWFDARIARAEGHRVVAAAYVSRWLTNAPAILVAGALALGDVVPDVSAENLALHRTPIGWVDRVALRSGRYAGVAGTPSADGSSLVVADRAALLAWCADELVAAVEPAMALARSVSPVARRGQWGALTDAAASVVVQLWRDRVLDRALALRAWDDIESVFDRAASAGAAAITRPRVTIDGEPGPLATGWVRGVCCLFFAMPSRLGRPDADRYCATCPITCRRPVGADVG